MYASCVDVCMLGDLACIALGVVANSHGEGLVSESLGLK